MSAQIPYRGPLTDAFVEWMRDSPELAGAEPAVLVGDGKVPDAAGWPAGQLGSGLFVSSVTVRTLDAAPAPMQPERLATNHTQWSMRYGMKTISVARTGADAIADVARDRAVAFPRTVLELGPAEWQVQNVVFERFAAVVPRGETDQETWEVDDSLVIWVARQRG